jgi:hypothetical protein
MMQGAALKHEFVEFIPDDLEQGTLYVSIAFATVAHKCCCGCGKEIVTPLSPTDWKLIFDGESISLDPSIGNWSLECQSHYWIRRSQVQWAPQWSREEIDAGRTRDRFAKERYFGTNDSGADSIARDQLARPKEVNGKLSFWNELGKWWRQLRSETKRARRPK